MRLNGFQEAIEMFALIRNTQGVDADSGPTSDQPGSLPPSPPRPLLSCRPAGVRHSRSPTCTVNRPRHPGSLCRPAGARAPCERACVRAVCVCAGARARARVDSRVMDAGPAHTSRRVEVSPVARACTVQPNTIAADNCGAGPASPPRPARARSSRQQRACTDICT